MTVLAGMFAIDCVLCKRVSQLFACVLVPCVSNRCEETVTVICPEATLSSPDMVDEIYRICMGTTHCATLGTTAAF